MKTLTHMFVMALVLGIPTLAMAQDSDGDGLSDADETNIYMSNTMNVDSDGDGLSDSAEVLIYQTNPIVKDSDNGGTDDYTEILSGTDPNLNTDDGSQPVAGTGSSSTWILSPATMNSVASAESQFTCLSAAGTRHFTNNDVINYTDQASAHGPFGTGQIRTQDVWGGTDPSFYVFTFMGYLIVPPATMSNPTNTHTFAASTDDGFSFRIFDGTTVQSTQFNANRGISTGPLLAVDFPDEGGVFPYDFMIWEQGGAVGAKLSWAPGTQTTFSEATFSLIPSTNMIAPEVSATQSIVDVNGGTVQPGDVLEATVTLTNSQPATAYNVNFTPNVLTNLTFGSYTQTPSNASINGTNPQQLDIPILNPNDTVTFTYTVTAGATGPYTAQGFVRGDTSAVATLGTNRLCLLTDDLAAQEGTDSGNRSQNLFADAQFDDDPNTFAVDDDLTPPAVSITSPANNAALDSGTFAATGATEVGASVEVTVLDDNGATIFNGPAVVDGAGNWTSPIAGLADGDYTISATSTDAAGNNSTTTNAFSVDTVAPAITLVTPADNSITNDNTPTISGVTEANTPVVVEIRDENNMIVATLNTTSDGTGNYSVDATTLADGDFTVSTTATDAAGNATTTGPSAFTVDTATGVTITDPAMAGTTTSDATPSISGNAEPGASVEVVITNSAGMVVDTQTATAANNGAWTVTGNLPADGAYNIAVTSTDAANNTASAMTTLNLDTVDPALTIATPANNSSTNDTTPTISGTTEANATVQLEIRDSNNAVVESLTVTADGMGNYAVDAATLPEGDYTIAGLATDAAGNTAITGPNVFSVDTTAPAVTLVEPANGTQTNDNTPALSGTADPNSTVTVVISDANGVVQTLTTSADGTGNYSVDAATLADGDYSVVATATDAAGNTSPATAPNAFSVDTAAPTVTLDTPADGTQTNDNTVTITGTAATGDTVTVTVTNQNNVVVATLSPMVDAQGNWTVDTSALPDDVYSIEATATDAAGNTATAPAHVITVDTSAPALTLDTPASGTFTNDDTPTITGTTDPNTTVTVTITDDMGTIVQTLTPPVDNAGNWTIDANTLPEGTYTIDAQATDGANNVTSAGPNTVAIDLTNPTVTIDNPADGSVTANVRPDISGSTEPGSAVAVTVTDSTGAVILTTTTTADGATGAWTVSGFTSDLVDGDYTINAEATDLAGNTGSTTGTFSVDTTALPLDITAPTAGDSLTDNTPDVTGTTAPNETVTIVVTDNNGMTIETQTITADAMGNWSATLSMLNDGTYAATATVTNPAGTTTTQNTSFSVDTTAPALTVTAPVTGDVTNDNTPAITGTTEPGVAVTIVITDANGAPVETLTPTVDGMGGWTIDPSTLPDGDYVITVTATDAAGNTTTAPDVTVTVDTTAPALTIATPTDNELVATRDLDITGTSDANQDVVVEVLDANGVVVDTQTVTTDANGDWTIQVTNLANGDYTARATATDAAMNTTTIDRPFKVDSEDALVQINNPVNDSTTTASQPSIDGTADADATVSVVIKDMAGNVIETLTPMVNDMGMWSVMPSTMLADGQYTIEATATRPNGKSAMATTTFTVDTVGPDTTLLTPADGMQGNDNQPAITGTTEPNATVTVTVTNAAGTVVFTGDVTADANGDWSITPDMTLADDTYTISASSVDEAGNAGPATTGTFTVDTNAPTVVITSPSNDDTVDDTTPTISGTGEPGNTIEIIIDGEKAGEAVVDDQGNWTFEVPESDALTTGEHTIEATSTDSSGNSGSSGTITITVEEPKAPVTITSPGNGAQVDGPDVTIEGTGEPGEEITVTVNGKEETVIVDGDGTWTVTVTDVPDGDTTITAKAGDDEATVTVTVSAPDNSAFILQGAGCSSAPGTPNNSAGILLLTLVGGLVLRRKRR